VYDIVNNLNHEIFKEKNGPLISIYQNTHRNVSENGQDMIRFKNTLKQVEVILDKDYPEKKEALLDKLYEIRDDKPFWNQTQEGIAIFVSMNQTVVFNLRRSVDNLLVINNYFHRKPLIKHFQTLDDYYILALGKDDFELYEGSSDELHKIQFESRVPTTKEEVLGHLQDEKYLSHASYGGSGANAMYHGHSDKKHVFEEDLERFFHYVDAFVNEEFTQGTKRPLILCALPEYHGIFKKISNNKHLHKEGIKRSNKDLDTERLRKDAWAILEKEVHATIEKLVDNYRNAQTKDLGSNILADIAKGAINARIDTVLIEQNKIIPGFLNKESGQLSVYSDDVETHGNILDEIAHHVIENGGNVYILEEDNMPSDTGVAAIYRY